MTHAEIATGKVIVPGGDSMAVRPATPADLLAIDSLRKKYGDELGFLPIARYEHIVNRTLDRGRRRWEYERLYVIEDNQDLTGFVLGSVGRWGGEVRAGLRARGRAAAGAGFAAGGEHRNRVRRQVPADAAMPGRLRHRRQCLLDRHRVRGRRRNDIHMVEYQGEQEQAETDRVPQTAATAPIRRENHMSSRTNGHERGCCCGTCIPNRTHAQMADHCLQPIEEARQAHEMHDDATGPLAIEEAKARICQALADQRRQHLDAQAEMLCDATPHRTPEPKA